MIVQRKSEMHKSRRDFIKTSGVLVTGSSFLISGTKASGNIIGANDRVRMAVAGLNGRGGSHIGGWGGQKNVEVVSLIDPDQKVLGKKLEQLKGAKGFADVRVALEDKNLDGISIATPNHWHSLMTIWAAQAGKHVYVEKPMSHDIAEGKIVERGTHRQLLSQKGLYAQMWERQSSGFQDDDLPSTIMHNKVGLQGV